LKSKASCTVSGPEGLTKNGIGLFIFWLKGRFIHLFSLMEG